MNINDIESLAMRLRSLTRRADMFGKSRDAILWEIADIAADLEKQVDRMDREMEDAYLEEMAQRDMYRRVTEEFNDFYERNPV